MTLPALCFVVKLDFGTLVFAEGGNRRTQRKTFGATTRTNNKVNPYVTTGTGIEPGPEWREARALTIAQEKEDQTQ